MDESLLRQLHLRYATDAEPGIHRVTVGKRFRYISPDGHRITDEKTLARIDGLHIPPAYTDVWICRWSNGHLQATGRDAKNRKQYRYHARFVAERQFTKFDHLRDFAAALPRIRQQVARDMAATGLPRDKVLATVVWLLENTLIRVGNEAYVHENKSYGLTTLQTRHAHAEGATVRFSFKGKSGVVHDVSVRNRRLAGVIRRCQELPGQALFQYVDETGARQTIDSADINDYLRGITGSEITAKDFRTWAGTVHACGLLDECGPCDDEAGMKKNLVAVVNQVATRLRNKPATCRKYYIHPQVLAAYAQGYCLSTLPPADQSGPGLDLSGLEPFELATLRILALTLADSARSAA
jgi:DNA topoisomerase-1